MPETASRTTLDLPDIALDQLDLVQERLEIRQPTSGEIIENSNAITASYKLLDEV